MIFQEELGLPELRRRRISWVLGCLLKNHCNRPNQDFLVYLLINYTSRIANSPLFASAVISAIFQKNKHQINLVVVIFGAPPVVHFHHYVNLHSFVTVTPEVSANLDFSAFHANRENIGLIVQRKNQRIFITLTRFPPHYLDIPVKH